MCSFRKRDFGLKVIILIPIAYCSRKLASVPTGQIVSSKDNALCSRVFSSMSCDFS